MTAPGWVQLIVAKDTFEGQLMSGVLEGAGIPVVVETYAGGGEWFEGTRPQSWPVVLMVPEDRVDDARQALDDAAQDGGDFEVEVDTAGGVEAGEVGEVPDDDGWLEAEAGAEGPEWVDEEST
ncbi:MAG: hypothetical protein M3238_03465, partial [Actinomycetota bacterium]|nr:hypothetical protein [Actinomycetota bacterium]